MDDSLGALSQDKWSVEDVLLDELLEHFGLLEKGLCTSRDSIA
jgi:hypothetical protein